MVIGISDINFQEAENLTDQYRCKAFKDYEELLSAPGINAVSICTPDAIHKGQSLLQLK